jgi:hypothetical protein
LGVLRRGRLGSHPGFRGRGGLAPRGEDRPPSLLRGANYQGASRFLMANRLVIKKLDRLLVHTILFAVGSCNQAVTTAAAAGRRSPDDQVRALRLRLWVGRPTAGIAYAGPVGDRGHGRHGGAVSLGRGRDSSLARPHRPNVQVSRVSARLAASTRPSQQDRVFSVPQGLVRCSACLTRRHYLAEPASGAWTSSPSLTGLRGRARCARSPVLVRVSRTGFRVGFRLQSCTYGERRFRLPFDRGWLGRLRSSSPQERPDAERQPAPET